MKIKKTTFLILAIFAFGAFLRWAKIGENLLFDAELGVDYLVIKSLILTGKLPLIGPATSHSWLHLGPAYYWLMMPLMIFSNFNPQIGTYFLTTAGSFMILLNYWVIKRVFNQKVALFSSFLIATSPFLILFSRIAKYYFLLVIPFYFLVWFLYKVWQGEGRFLFWVGLTFGIILNFHLSPIALVPTIFIILWVKRKNLGRKDLFFGLFGFLIPNLPFLLYDFLHGLPMTSKLLVWIPYRILGFLGFYPKNNLTPEVFRQNLLTFYYSFSDSFVIGQRNLGILFSAAIIIFLILNFRKAFATKKKEDFGWFFLFWALVLTFLALFVHGLPPKPYFIVICPVLILVFSLLLEKLWSKPLMKVIILTLLFLVNFFNFRFFLASPLFYASQGDFTLSLKFQERIVKAIVDDSQGEKFNLSRVGEFDYYEGTYAQNYQYLAWFLGNEPTEEKVNLRYTIYEETQNLQFDIRKDDELFRVGRVYILKTKLK